VEKDVKELAANIKSGRDIMHEESAIPLWVQWDWLDPSFEKVTSLSNLEEENVPTIAWSDPEGRAAVKAGQVLADQGNHRRLAATRIISELEAKKNKSKKGKGKASALQEQLQEEKMLFGTFIVVLYDYGTLTSHRIVTR
jgi:hypothetical protein